MWQLASESHRFLGGSWRHLSGSHPLLCCVTRVAAWGALCFLRSTVRWSSQSCFYLFLPRALGLRMGGAEQDRRLCHRSKQASGPRGRHGQRPLALQHRRPGLRGPFPLPALRARQQPGWLLRTVSAALLRVPELDGVTVPGRAPPPSCRFLCPAQAVSASFCGNHNEYSGRVLEDPVRKKNRL